MGGGLFPGTKENSARSPKSEQFSWPNVNAYSKYLKGKGLRGAIPTPIFGHLASGAVNNFTPVETR
jgi:hypothetical protein